MTTNLERWRFFLEDCESPDIYIDYTFLVTISAALQRNVCYKQVPHKALPGSIFPNLYVIFIGPPGVGKSFSARWSKNLFQSFGGFAKLDEASKRLIKVAPNSITLEQLYRYLNNNYTIVKLPEQYKEKNLATYLHSALAFFCTEELGTLMVKHTEDLVTFLQEGYDCGDFHRETKGAGVDFIKNMCVTLFGCGTPDWVREVSGNGLLRQGFSARAIFIYAEKRRKLKFDFTVNDEKRAEFEKIRQHVKSLTELYGQVTPTPEAEEFCRAWYHGGGEIPTNKDKRLADYYNRKRVHLIRMAMVCHFMDKTDLTLTLDDFRLALQFLARAEIDMHKALLGSSQNNAYTIACAIEKILQEGSNGEPKWIRHGDLLLELFSECQTGMEDFDSALKYLTDTDTLQVENRQGKLYYALRPK